jgi:hypothetical protein
MLFLCRIAQEEGIRAVRLPRAEAGMVTAMIAFTERWRKA